MSMTQLSFSEASALIERCPYSSLHKVSTVRHIVLPPKFLGNISNGVKEKLNSELQLVTNWTDGVLVAYNNVKVLDHVGKIFEESPYVHFNIQADFIIFKPTIGCVLKGIVNKKSPRHVGCLVHNCFNASVHKPQHEGEDWQGNGLHIGEEFMFKVTNLYVHNDVMSLRGNLWEESSMGKKGAGRQKTEILENMEEGEGSASDLADSGIGDIVLQKPSKKKKKSSKDSDLLSGSTLDDNAVFVKMEIDEEAIKRSDSFSDHVLKENDKSSKKKKKKHKHDKHTFDIKEEPNCEDQFKTSSSLDASKHKKHKKKKKPHLGDGDKHSQNFEDSFDISKVKVEGGISIKKESFGTSQINGQILDESVSKKKKNKKTHQKGEFNKSGSLELPEDSGKKAENENKAKKRKHSSVHETIEHSLPKKKNRKSV